MRRFRRQLLKKLPGKRLRKLIATIIGSKDKWLPDKVYPDDLYLVSYPKSGNTWVRFMFANLLKTDPDEIIDFHTVDQYVAEANREVRFANNLPRPRILKSHALYVPEFPRVIYIVRDVRDAYVSYYHYVKGYFPPGLEFSAWLRKDDIWPSRWHQHVRSWLDKPNVLLVRYEDMLEDVVRELRRMVDFWGEREYSDEQLARAAAASDFKTMKSLEQERGRPAYDLGGHQGFMRKGASGDGISLFDEQDELLIKEEVGDLLERLGYRESIAQS